MTSVPFLSVCSGIEAASVALEPLGFIPVGFAEIDRAASRVLAHHYGSNLPGDALSHNGVPNHGDFTAIDVEALPPVAWLIGGTPCQAFSVAGKRLSLADARGNLSLAYAVLAHELVRSRGLEGALWENVPGVLSTSDNAFGCLLGALVGADDPVEPCPKPRRGKSNDFWKWRPAESGVDEETGEPWSRPEGHVTAWPDEGMVEGPRARAAWRVLDAQYFGLAQRRRRVFLVIGFGDDVDPAAILFEPASMSRNHPPRREAGQRPAGTLSARTEGGGGLGTDFDLDGGQTAVSMTLSAARGASCAHADLETYVPVAFGGGDVSGPIDPAATLLAKGHRSDFEVETFVIASEDGITSAANYSKPKVGDPCHPLAAGAHAPAVAFDLRGRDGGAQFEGPHDTANIRAASGGSSRSYVARVSPTLRAGGNATGGDRPPGTDVDTSESLIANSGAASAWAVRRLTPAECERLQGFPDNYTLVPDAKGKLQADGPRYKQLGNSMAVPCVAWIGRRILGGRS